MPCTTAQHIILSTRSIGQYNQKVKSNKVEVPRKHCFSYFTSEPLPIAAATNIDTSLKHIYMRKLGAEMEVAIFQTEEAQ